jgi:thyroxine 5-deiodinase
MCAEFEGRATFVVVYLEEAHPTDGWMFEAVVHQVAQHTSSEERHCAAKVLQGELDTAIAAAQLGAPAAATVRTPNILVDSMANLASTTFGALPERLAVLVEGKVVFLGGKGPEDYSVADCKAALAALC